MNKPRLTAEIIQDRVAKLNPNIKLIGEYTGIKRPIKVTCQKCKYIWLELPKNLERSALCPICSKNVRLNDKIFKLRIQKNNPKIEIIGKFNRTDKPVKAKCKKCNCIWEPIAENILTGSDCPKCCRDATKLTDHEFKSKMKTANSKVEVIGKYSTTKIPITVKCLKCSYKWKAQPSNLLRNSGCPKCAGKIITTKKLRKKITEKNSKVIPIGKYIKGSKYILVKCKNCNYVWNAIISNLLHDSGCPKCANNQRLTDTEFKKRVKKYHPNIIILEEYQGSKSKIRVLCKQCSHKWDAQPDHLMRGAGCPKCAGNLRLSFKEFKQRLKINHPTFLILPGQKYINTDTKIKIQCEYGHQWFATPHSLIGSMNSGCPKCATRYKTSFPEQAIFFYLKKIFPKAINSYHSEWLKRQELDIYIPNTNLGKVGIEYDGYAFHKDNKRDQQKYQKCKNNNVFLIRIHEDIKKEMHILPTNCDKQIWSDTKQVYLEQAIIKLVHFLKPESKLKVNIENDRNKIYTQYLFSYEKSLEKLYPKIAKEWDKNKNGALLPSMISPTFSKMVWWKCRNGHSWQNKVNSRTQRNINCPEC